MKRSDRDIGGKRQEARKKGGEAAAHGGLNPGECCGLAEAPQPRSQLRHTSSRAWYRTSIQQIAAGFCSLPLVGLTWSHERCGNQFAAARDFLAGLRTLARSYPGYSALGGRMTARGLGHLRIAVSVPLSALTGRPPVCSRPVSALAYLLQHSVGAAGRGGGVAWFAGYRSDGLGWRRVRNAGLAV